MKTLKQLIQDEQRRVREANDEVRCFAINHFGKGQHAYADSVSLPHFTPNYVRRCLRKMADSDGIKPEFRQRAKELAK